VSFFLLFIDLDGILKVMLIMAGKGFPEGSRLPSAHGCYF
jgi:hypothetical protein